MSIVEECPERSCLPDKSQIVHGWMAGMVMELRAGLGAMMIVGGVREGGVERDASRNRMKLEWAC
jgi:hypothetical protein